MFKKKITVDEDKILTFVLVLLGIAMFIAAFARIFNHAFWGDEAFTANLIQNPVSKIIEISAKSDAHPPLYYLIVVAFCKVLGHHGWTLHLASVVPFGLLILFALFKVRKEFGNLAAIILIVCSGMMNSALTYNLEVRNYSWAALFTFLAYCYVWDVLNKNSRKSWSLFTFFSLCAAYTHYYALIAVAFLYAGLLICSVIRREYAIKCITSCIVTILVYLPWFYFLIRAYQKRAESWWLKGIPTVHKCLLFYYSYDEIMYLAIFALILAVCYESGLLEVTKHGCRKYIVSFNKKMHSTVFQTWLSLGMCSVIGMPAFGFLLSHLVRPFFINRYLYANAYVCWLIFGVCLTKLKSRTVICGVFIVLFLFHQIPEYKKICEREKKLDDDTYAFENKFSPNQNDVVITNSNHHSWTILKYYYPQAKILKQASDKTLLTFIEENNGKPMWILWQKEIPSKMRNAVSRKGGLALVHKGRIGNEAVLSAYRFLDNAETARIDIFNSGADTNGIKLVDITDSRATIRTMTWVKSGGNGKSIESAEGKLTARFRCMGDGKLKINLRGRDVRDENDKRIPYWIDYTSFIVNGTTIFDGDKNVWHDKPHTLSFEVKDNDIIEISATWRPASKTDIKD